MLPVRGKVLGRWYWHVSYFNAHSGCFECPFHKQEPAKEVARPLITELQGISILIRETMLERRR
jgi:hypothetical protein